VSVLPPPGRWALGDEAQRQAELLLQTAQQQGLRTAWLAPDARFLSNLNIIENLRVLHDWHERAAGFEADLEAALERLGMVPPPAWLQQRPSSLRDRQLLLAGLLRVFLLAPDVVVLHPGSLAQAGAGLTARLVETFAEARLLLLGEADADWPAWPGAVPDVPVEENPV
jgi:hypothetical protein